MKSSGTSTRILCQITVLFNWLYLVSVHFCRFDTICRLILLNKFSTKTAVRHAVCSSVPETFCTKLFTISTITIWNNINLFCECSALPEVLNKFSYVILPEHVDTFATRAHSIIKSLIASHSEHICPAHTSILLGTVRNIHHAVQEITYIPYQST